MASLCNGIRECVRPGCEKVVDSGTGVQAGCPQAHRAHLLVQFRFGMSAFQARAHAAAKSDGAQ